MAAAIHRAVTGEGVSFHPPSEKRRLCAWEARCGERTIVPATVTGVGSSIPHDLAQGVIEAATGYQRGFWSLIALGATFKSTGRKRPGRTVIAEHRADLVESEALAGEHLTCWATAGHPAHRRSHHDVRAVRRARCRRSPRQRMAGPDRRHSAG